MSSVWDIERWVDEAAVSAIRRFYPTALTHDISLPLSEIMEHLLFLVDQNKLNILWEIRCPICYATVAIKSDYIISGDIMECPLGHEFELSLDVIFPVFEVSESYRTAMREYKKKLHDHGGLIRGTPITR